MKQQQQQQKKLIFFFGKVQKIKFKALLHIHKQQCQPATTTSITKTKVIITNKNNILSLVVYFTTKNNIFTSAYTHTHIYMCAHNQDLFFTLVLFFSSILFFFSYCLLQICFYSIHTHTHFP